MPLTEGPTGRKIGAPELLMTSAASLPARSACGIFALGAGHRVQGLWPQPRSEGKLYRAAVGALGLPYLRQEGQEEEPGVQVRRAAKVGMAWPGALQASPSSVPPLACLIPVGPSSALAAPGSLLYIFETSFYSL